MKDEPAFRSTAAALFVAAASISGYHRHRAERAGGDEISAVEEEGLSVVRRSLVRYTSCVSFLGTIFAR